MKIFSEMGIVIAVYVIGIDWLNSNKSNSLYCKRNCRSTLNSVRVKGLAYFLLNVIIKLDGQLKGTKWGGGVKTRYIVQLREL